MELLINSNNKFQYLKSDYFLQKLFGNLHKKNLLQIIKYNKAIQQRIKISINDYKEFSEIYSSIEMEIIPLINKYGKFINIKEEENRKYYHIYFNDNTDEEIKSLYLKSGDNVSKINVVIDYQVKSFEELFSECEYIESIKFKKIYRKNIENICKMFSYCTYIKEIDFSNFNPNNLTEIYSLFFDCKSLTKINISNFNTINIKSMYSLFYGCSSLVELNLSNFNTQNVTSMNGMFSGCISLKEINLTNFNTNNVTDMYSMFSGCKSLKTLNLSNFNTEKVTDMGNMFYYCYSL